MSKPELPAFLQRMKEQIVANEDAERKEQSQKKRKSGTSKPGDDEDDPTIVRIGDEDLTEEEYKRLKLSKCRNKCLKCLSLDLVQLLTIFLYQRRFRRSI